MSNRVSTTEQAFEDTIVRHLCEHGYELGDNERWSRELAFDRYTLLEFIQATQPEAWENFSAIHGSDVERRFLLRLFKELDNRGTIDVLPRHRQIQVVGCQARFLQARERLQRRNAAALRQKPAGSLSAGVDGQRAERSDRDGERQPVGGAITRRQGASLVPLQVSCYKRPMSFHIGRFFLCLLASLALSPSIPQSNIPASERFWPQWRGPYATGVSKTATPPLQWSETKNIRWKVEIPGPRLGVADRLGRPGLSC